MKNFATILFLSTFIIQLNAQNVYDDALTAASYAYAHSKKAHGANNVFHTQEYADKALEAFEKVEALSDQCGCSEANELAYEAMSNMESALYEDTYERSRYYAKQAKELSPRILEELTNCQSDASTDTYADVASIEEDDIAEVSAEVAKKEEELENRKRQLEIEQAKLEQQIAEQQKLQAEFEALRAAELKEQALIKDKAEQALAKLETALHELGVALNDESKFESKKEYVRSENDLQNETLDDTKSFYVNRAKELAQSAMQQFASFEEND